MRLSFYIRPYWKTFDGTKVYGESKCVAIDDQGKTNINMTVEANDPGAATTIPVSVAGGAAVDAELLKWEDGYACINIPVTDKTTLKSVSIVEVTDANLKVADTKSSFRNVKTVYDGTEASKDTSWYNADDSKFVLVTSADLYGFASLNNDFADKKVCLASDITVNSGSPLGADGVKDTAGDTTPDDWSNATVGSSLLAWTPIANFAGTFDGDMNTISGIYMKADLESLALFANVSGTVQQFILENSYIENTGTKKYTGSVVGTLSGTLDTVKSSADVKLNGSEYAGGMVGIMTGSAGTIKNCWFDGTVSGSCNHQSAFLGGMPNSNAKGYMVNCLSTGKVDMRANTGGLIGTFWNSGVELTIENSLFGGEFVNVGASVWGNFGTLAAQVQKGTIKASNVYTITQSYVYNSVTKNAGLLGNAGTNKTTGMTSLAAASLQDESAYMNLDFDFFIDDANEEAKWLAVENDYPILASFAKDEQAVDLATVSGTRTFWHNKATDGADEFVLYTPADFRGFQTLSKTETFAGDTVKLGANINLNPNWDASQPTVGTSAKMDPIGSFAGTFDGDMHKVEGVYIVSGVAKTGLFSEVSGTVKNLILENSRIENTMASGEGYTGSVIGRLTGTLDTVKSSAYVVLSGSQYAGGLVGLCAGSSTTVSYIKNSWFAGSISGTGERHGGLLGGMKDASSKANIEHCLVTGDIARNSRTGGLVGAVWAAKATLTITDTLYAGQLVGTTVPSDLANILGRLVRSELVLNNVYILDGSGAVTKDATGGTHTDDQGTATITDNGYARLKDYQLAFDEAKVNTDLTICDEADYGNEDVVGKTKFWYVADKHPVLASFSEVPAYSKLKVATYNIKYCTNHGETTATMESIRNDVAKFIKDNNIDICLLQEVDGDCVRSGRKNQAEEIAKTLGTEWQWKYQKTTENYIAGRYSYGVAIVSKYPIVSTETVHIQNCEEQKEPRVIFKSMINVNGTQVAVINTHVDDTAEATSKAISEAQKMINAIPASTPIIFGGDLNDIPTQSTPIAIGELLASVTAGRDAVKTHYSMQIDYLFTSNHFAQGLTEVLDPTCSAEDLADQPISDHKPLVATLYLKAQ